MPGNTVNGCTSSASSQGGRIDATGNSSIGADQGDLCIFASKSCRRTVNRRERWVDLEHGMTPVTHGVRFAFGIVLHPAQ